MEGGPSASPASNHGSLRLRAVSTGAYPLLGGIGMGNAFLSEAWETRLSGPYPAPR